MLPDEMEVTATYYSRHASFHEHIAQREIQEKTEAYRKYGTNTHAVPTRFVLFHDDSGVITDYANGSRKVRCNAAKPSSWVINWDMPDCFRKRHRDVLRRLYADIDKEDFESSEYEYTYEGMHHGTGRNNARHNADPDHGARMDGHSGGNRIGTHGDVTDQSRGLSGNSVVNAMSESAAGAASLPYLGASDEMLQTPLPRVSEKRYGVLKACDETLSSSRATAHMIEGNPIFPVELLD